MKKLYYSDFVQLDEIIKSIDFNVNNNSLIEKIEECWKETVGNKISALTKIDKISDNKVVTIQCADSFVSNELYREKVKIIEILDKKLTEKGIKIKDIVFDYRKWKDKNEE